MSKTLSFSGGSAKFRWGYAKSQSGTLSFDGGTLSPEALLRMVAPGAGFRDVTLYDATPFMKTMSKSR